MSNQMSLFGESEADEVELQPEIDEEERAAWRQKKKEAKARMVAMQALPYEVKIKRAELRAREFVEKLDDMDLNAHVSVGGLDSIVLLLFLRKIEFWMRC